jgi:predicted dehydrogenase
MLVFALLSALAIGPAAFAAEPAPWATRELRAGVIGTDTSHVPAFAELFRLHPEWKIKTVAAFKGGSPDIPASADRIERFATTMREKYQVEFVNSIEELLTKVDVVLLQSVDGRVHLEQVKPVLKAGKRVFIDKPIAASAKDAREIVALAKSSGTPFFSASTARFGGNMAALRDNPGVGKVTKVQGSSSLSKLPGHPDLAFYGIHGVEALYSVMGRGCVSVSRKLENGADITTGKWKDGRTGVYYSPRKDEKAPAVQIWGTQGTAEFVKDPNARTYEALVRQIAEFFHTGRPPVDPAESIEVMEFIEAAQLSHERGGKEVMLQETRRSL